ncbi:ArsR/SmtB family transcription factor [Frondihabitans australicus]|uniref:Helix-turn-helix protein n=1 Tax=Frondihabitans australicus TaxID=386892 RepID=A0A495IHU5_9MICO|nr:metalloregulator ArsR/SmtB family transcription factor [Frondihabitans australicus]RKR75602.1 helix-turn-helix protein [Frondihabitans australicus]
MTITADDTRVLAALADETRQGILDVLGRAPASASALARELPISRQGTMKHLAVLESARLVRGAREGREVVYAVDTAPLRAAAEALARASEHWDRQLLLLKRAAEHPEP